VATYKVAATIAVLQLGTKPGGRYGRDVKEKRKERDRKREEIKKIEKYIIYFLEIVIHNLY
jgi:hypothetical protein